MKRRFLLDIVVRKCAAILELLASEDQTLLIRRNALLVLDLLLHVLDGVRGLHVEGDGLTREGLHENLHALVNWLKNLVEVDGGGRSRQGRARKRRGVRREKSDQLQQGNRRSPLQAALGALPRPF